MSFQGHKDRIFILSECQCPGREISVFVSSSGGFRKYAILVQGGRNVLSAICGFDLSRSLSEGRSYCMRTTMFSRQSDILFLLGKTFQIEKKRPERIRSFPVFRPFFSRCTEVAGMMCGEKKCFFSQAIFRSAEIETRLDLKTVEKQAEIPKICI